MAFKLTLCPREPGKLNDILVDIITSAAYFNKRDVEIQQNSGYLIFVFPGDCPEKYLDYLRREYNLSKKHTQ